MTPRGLCPRRRPPGLAAVVFVVYALRLPLPAALPPSLTATVQLGELRADWKLV